jgi:hypothetical protein
MAFSLWVSFKLASGGGMTISGSWCKILRALSLLYKFPALKALLPLSSLEKAGDSMSNLNPAFRVFSSGP